MRLDLHCHSTCSDGADPPRVVAARARDLGAVLFALTDHDTCAGSNAAGEELGDAAVRAVELTCHDGGRAVHILVYDAERGSRWEKMRAHLERLRAARRRRLRSMAARLEQRGVRVDVDAAIARAGPRPVGRPDLARALVDAGVVGSVRAAFTRFLRDGGPIDEPMDALSVGEGLEIARCAGGRAALAHPHTLGARAGEIVRRFKGAGLGGIEAVYGTYDRRARARWSAMADAEGLVVTAGSDYHGRGAASDLVLDLDDDRAGRLCEWLRVQPRTASAARS